MSDGQESVSTRLACARTDLHGAAALQTDMQGIGGQALLASAGLLAIRLVGLAAAFVATMQLARMLTPANYAIVATAMSIATLGALIASANLGATALRFLPRYRAEGLAAAEAGYRSTVRRTTLLATVFCSIVAGALFASGAGHSGRGISIAVGLLALPLFCWMRTEAALVHAIGRAVLSSVPNLLVRPLVFALVIILLGILGRGSIELSAAFGALVGAAALGALVQGIVSLRLDMRAPGDTTANAIDRTDAPVWFASAAALAVPTVLLEFGTDIVVLVSSVALVPEDAAGIAVIMRLQAILVFGVSSVNMAFGPKLARAESSGKPQVRDRLLRLSAHLKFWPSLLLFAVLVGYAPEVLTLFGPHYSNYGTALVVVALTPVVLAFFGPTIVFVTVLGLERQARSIFLIALAALIALIVLGGRIAGPVGVSGGVLVVWIGWNAALHALVRRCAGFSTTPFLPFASDAGFPETCSTAERKRK